MSNNAAYNLRTATKPGIHSQSLSFARVERPYLIPYLKKEGDHFPVVVIGDDDVEDVEPDKSSDEYLGEIDQIVRCLRN